jgi:hypothetical protein
MEYSGSTAPAAPGSDPGEGQGAPESQGGSIFDPYLQTVPEASRSIVEGYLKDAEKNVNSQLSEAADLRKQFGDYKDVDLSGIAPDQLSEVLQFVQQVGQSPEAYQEWLRSEAEAAGLLTPAEQEQEAEGEQDLEAYIQDRIEKATGQIDQRLSQFEQSNQERAQNEAQSAMETHITSTLGNLESEAKVKLTDEQQEAVLALGEQVQTDDWVEQGFAKFQALTGQAQAGLVKDKLAQPAPSLRTGGQATPPSAKSFADVREQALEIINQAL